MRPIFSSPARGFPACEKSREKLRWCFTTSQGYGPSSFFNLTTVPDDPTCVRVCPDCLRFFCETVKTMTSFGAICWQAGLAQNSPLTCVARAINSRWPLRVWGLLSDMQTDNGLLHPFLKLPNMSVLRQPPPKAACQAWQREVITRWPRNSNPSAAWSGAASPTINLWNKRNRSQPEKTVVFEQKARWVPWMCARQHRRMTLIWLPGGWTRAPPIIAASVGKNPSGYNSDPGWDYPKRMSWDILQRHGARRYSGSVVGVLSQAFFTAPEV